MQREARNSAVDSLPASSTRFANVILWVLALPVAIAFGYFIVFSRTLSMDEGYLMVTVQGFIEGHPLYDVVFTQYGPLYYFYQWILRVGLRLPLTHDATRLLCLAHWLGASCLLGLAVRRLTGSALAGAFGFMQAVVHLSLLANEPGHPQELVVVLLALALLVISGQHLIRQFWILVGLAVALAFIKVNVGVFFGLAVVLGMAAGAKVACRRIGWYFIVAGCAASPFLLMRHHLAVEWCRNYSLVAAMTLVSVLLGMRRLSWSPQRTIAAFLPAVAFGAALTVGLWAITLISGTSVRGFIDGLLLTPLKMPSVAVLPIQMPDLVVLNAVCSLGLAAWVASRYGQRLHPLVTALKAIYAAVGALLLMGDIQEQLRYLLPWLWLVNIPPALRPLEDEDARKSADGPARIFLSLAAAWQALQAYPIAGTQVVAATFLLLPVYTLCLTDAVGAIRLPQLIQRVRWGGRLPQAARLAPTLVSVMLAALFANVWCRLPDARRHHAGLVPIQLPGSRLVRFDAETAALYQELVEYLRVESDAFVTYPGLNSLYFWAEQRPPTQLNSTGWGQLSHARQEQILVALRQHSRGKLVIVESLMASWGRDGPAPLAPLVRAVREEFVPARRLGPFIIFAPRQSPAVAVKETDGDALR